MAFESYKMKAIGKPDEGKLQVRFDVAGYGNGVQLLNSVICLPRHNPTLRVICCQYEKDAQRLREALGKRLAKYNLKLNEDKTKLVDFRKIFGKRAAFDFLGFTHYLGKSRKGFIIPKLKTIGKRFNSKLKGVNVWARTIRDKIKLADIWKLFCLKLRGHINYYAVSHNIRRVQTFVMRAVRIMLKWLNRRSQRKSFNWEKFQLFLKANPIPEVKVQHKMF